MNSFIKSVCFMLTALTFFSCSGIDNTAVPKIKYDFKSKNRQMVLVNAQSKIVEGKEKDGVFIENRKVTLSSYEIAKYEVDYELWSEVYDWAEQNGYRFANPGTCGYTGKNSGKEQNHPVTKINWRDAVVWCNAYSEMSGLTPVYKYNSHVCKDAVTEIKPHTQVLDPPHRYLLCEADLVEFDRSADGYRLPTEAEWEFAARGGDPSNEAWNYEFSGTNNAVLKDLQEYVWHKAPASKTDTRNINAGKPNSLGLFNTCGNVSEWCWDWYSEKIKQEMISDPSGPLTKDMEFTTGLDYDAASRVKKGGACDTNESYICKVTFRDENRPAAILDDLGFRVAKNKK